MSAAGGGWRRIDFGGVNPDWLVRQTRRGTAMPAETWEEVKAHWFNSAITRLQQGHKDPARPLTPANSIPLRQYHNQAMLDTPVLNDDGFSESGGVHCVGGERQHSGQAQNLAHAQG